MVEIWFDTRTGDQLIGEAAVSQRLEESGPGDVLPLKDIVLADSFPYRYGDFEPFHSQELTREDFINYGRWVINLLSSDERFSELHVKHLQRLARLGVGPGRGAIKQRTGSEFGQYRTEIGVPIQERENFGHWTRRHHVDRMRRLEAQYGRKPTSRELNIASEAGDGPPNWAMNASTGGTPADINELIGYPNVRAWDTEEPFIRWGAQVMAANNGRPLTDSVIRVLAGRKRGPSEKTIRENCDSTARFQELATQRYITDPTSYQTRSADARARLDTLRAQKLVNAWVGEHIGDVVAYIAQYDVTKDCVRDMDELEYQYWALEDSAKLVKRILQAAPHLVREDIYLSAIATKHTDDIWKLSDRWKQGLVIGPDEVVYKHQANRIRFTSPVTTYDTAI